MPRLKREIFLRPTRFQHRFGDRDDPMMPSDQTFEFNGPKLPKAINAASQKTDIHRDGLHPYTQPFSPIEKHRGGTARLGPKMDRADMAGETVPASTIERRTGGPVSEPSSKKGGQHG